MLNKNARKWVKALRSGKYKQCKHNLHLQGNGYCCLGVACELYIAAGNELEVRGGRGAVMYGGSYKILPRVVQTWLGLVGAFGEYVGIGREADCLTSQNDNGKTFQEIAAIIQSEPEGLFVETGGKEGK